MIEVLVPKLDQTATVSPDEVREDERTMVTSHRPLVYEILRTKNSESVFRKMGHWSKNVLSAQWDHFLDHWAAKAVGQQKY